jgi:glycosyltransferase involved in cell wall biosynthesis
LAQAAVDLVRRTFNVELITVSGVPHKLVPLYMNACDVLILTSKHEGSPTVVKEALACDLPIVSVDVGDVRNRIEGIQGCILCSDDSPETIASALSRIFQHRNRIQGRETVADLREELIVEKIIGVYRSAILEHNKP